MRALIVADGDVPSAESLADVLARQPVDARSLVTEMLVIAADGGALKAASLGLRPDVIVGDTDSLSPDRVEALRTSGAEVLVHPAAKDESDTELALREALARGATNVVVLGAFGGQRLDHALANVLLLTLPELSGIDVVMADEQTTVHVITGGDGHSAAVAGAKGDYVSLLPLTERVEGVTTVGLAYSLDADTLIQGPTRGLSNALAGDSGQVSVRSGRLAVIHTRTARGATVV